MARQKAPAYREVANGPSKFELAKPKPGWSPLDDYRAAQAEDRDQSAATAMQNAAVLAFCSCPNCRPSQSTALPHHRPSDPREGTR